MRRERKEDKTGEREKKQDEERHRGTRDHAKARTPRELDETPAKRSGDGAWAQVRLEG